MIHVHVQDIKMSEPIQMAVGVKKVITTAAKK